MNSYAITDVGRKRNTNQDSVFSSETSVGLLPDLFIVADGMGGHNAGDFASRFCIEEFVRRLREETGSTCISVMDAALRGANEQLIIKGQEHPELEGMGTTFVAATIYTDYMYVVNVGDSRLYLIDHQIRQITEDHSMVAEMVRNGDIRKEEARFHPNKNVVTRAISANGVVKPDFFEVPVKKGDFVLLCSDGLTSMIEDFEIFDIVQQYGGDVEQAAKKLVDLANENGGKDNISVVLAKL